MTFANENMIKRDRLRFQKNKLSANLAILAIVFNALYFVSIYKTDLGDYYYRLIIGISVVYNLLFMLATFLASEGVKAYKIGYSYLLMGLGIGQIVRIFIIPLQAKNTTLIVAGGEAAAMENAQFIRLCVYLIVSAGLLVVSALVNITKAQMLAHRYQEIERMEKGS